MMTANQPRGPWAERAAALYDGSYARHYRERDEQLQQVASNQALIDWLGAACDRFDRPIDVLDLGCGTGRYFWGLRRVRSLVGFDASEAMLAEARHPIHEDRVDTANVTLVCGDLMGHDFGAERFDLVYSIGVLAEHVPLDDRLIGRVRQWLRPGGRFAFTTVHPASPSVPRTLPRRLAEWALPILPEALTRGLHHRFVVGGMYGDERWLREHLSPGFVIESLERFQTDVHLHGLCVARKVGA
jgi:SAM-dependent methyltransferase